MYTKLNNDIETYTYDERHNHLTKRIQTGGSDTTDYYTMNIGDQLTERVKKHTQSQVVIEEEEYTYSDDGHLTSVAVDKPITEYIIFQYVYCKYKH